MGCSELKGFETFVFEEVQKLEGGSSGGVFSAFPLFDGDSFDVEVVGEDGLAEVVLGAELPDLLGWHGGKGREAEFFDAQEGEAIHDTSVVESFGGFLDGLKDFGHINRPRSRRVLRGKEGVGWFHRHRKETRFRGCAGL
jgi:hypothetical protein